MPDIFIENRKLLKGQPKKVIGDYVSQAGILVPRRFDSLEEALQFKGKVFVRSENPQDYDGESDLFQSCVLDLQFKDYQKLREYMISLRENRIHNFKAPEDALLINSIKSETSYSFWEYLEQGQNRTIIADNGVKGRYHILTNYPDKFTRWTIIEKGRIVSGEEADENLRRNFLGQIEFYESVRNLGFFDLNHCPSIEYQSIGEQNYFLQYYRTNDFHETDFVLDRDLEEKEVKADWVRGVTSKEGIQHRIQFPYTDGHYFINSEKNIYLKHVPLKRKEWEYFFHSHHRQVSDLFKPTLCICRDLDELYDPQELKVLFRQAHNLASSEEKKFQPPTLRFISDGRVAYIKRMD